MIENQTFPLISICIPAYNHQFYVGEAIQSVMEQSYPNIELIIINDGSKDGTDRTIQSFVDQYKNKLSRILYKSRENKGLVYTLNEMISLAQGKYIKFIASDDRLYDDTIGAFIDKMERENLDVLYGKLMIINRHGEHIQEIEGIRGLNSKFSFEEFSISKALEESPVIGSSWIINKDSLEKIGNFDVDSKIEDWALILKILAYNLNIGYIPIVGSCYRQLNNNSQPYLGSFKAWLKSDIYTLNKYKKYDCKIYRKAIRKLFMKNFINNKNYKNNEFIKLFSELLKYPFAYSLFLNPIFLTKILFKNGSTTFNLLRRISVKLNFID